MSTTAFPPRNISKFGLLAFLGAAASLAFCFWKATFGLVAPLIGLTLIDINPHLQALVMWLFAAIAVASLIFDRKKHGDNMPLIIGAAALFLIVGTLYIFYHAAILAAGYVFLLIAAFLNQNRMLSFLHCKIQLQASELAELNNSLERRITRQVDEIERLARLKRFLPAEVASLITTEGKETLLDSHRAYIACLFCDIRRFTSMTESMEPEDVMDVLRGFHEKVGRLVARYGGTIGYRAGDGVMVFFNDPIPCDDPDLRAVKLAFDVQQAFADLRKNWNKLDVDVGLGIGIASGYATMGLIGGDDRYDYTPIGNAVNLAARLSDQARDGQILVGRRTWAEIEQLVSARSTGTMSLKGMAQPAEVFLLEGLKQDATIIPLTARDKHT